MSKKSKPKYTGILTKPIENPRLGLLSDPAEEEAHYQAKQLKPILVPDWTFIAQDRSSEVVAAALTLPDYNQVLARLDGRLLPLGWIKALYWRRKIDRVRVLALGVKPEYQHTGVGAKLYSDHFDMCERVGVSGGEGGWVLENNRAMKQGMEAMNGSIERRLRIYGRDIGSANKNST